LITFREQNVPEPVKIRNLSCDDEAQGKRFTVGTVIESRDTAVYRMMGDGSLRRVRVSENSKICTVISRLTRKEKKAQKRNRRQNTTSRGEVRPQADVLVDEVK
jgi:hypothetical protein